ncbi:MAG: hypothetical protein CM1200mP10_23080 [Candidatus Neomarinimicrobiota bacterium]|nr:MAG: hypothetical protein CM1200mP10_23080 [Candidatus Neomarinimicrobiota bacterium]
MGSQFFGNSGKEYIWRCELCLEWSGICFWTSTFIKPWWPGTTRRGIIAGLLTGFLTTIIWANTEIKLIVTERLVSFVFAFLMVVIVSHMEKG